MQKRKLPRDSNSLAARIVALSTGQPEPDITGHSNRDTTADPKPDREKNPAAVALGRLGGLKGGKARAAKLTPRKRKAIARKAARARWKQP
jgi:hypothetical protein